MVSKCQLTKKDHETNGVIEWRNFVSIDNPFVIGVMHKVVALNLQLM